MRFIVSLRFTITQVPAGLAGGPKQANCHLIWLCNPGL